MAEPYGEIKRVVKDYELPDIDAPLGFHSPEAQAGRDIAEGRPIDFLSRRLLMIARTSIELEGQLADRAFVLAEVDEDEPEVGELSEDTKKLVAGISNALAVLIEDIRPIFPELEEKEYFLLSDVFEAAMRDLHPWKGAAIDKARTPVSTPRPMGQPDEINYPMPN
jgi:hypothetical protein